MRDSGLDPRAVREAVARALAEDLGPGDLTTRALLTPAVRGRAQIVAHAHGVVCGLPVAQETFAQLDPSIRWLPTCADGAAVQPDQVVAELTGSVASILAGERVALNFLQHMSGVASATATLVKACEGTQARILDTRKTVPGLRSLQRYAVRMGGGQNHRSGLFDAVLIKNNHLTAVGGVAAALTKLRANLPAAPIEIEVESLAQLDEALAAGAEWILLDNMDAATLREAVSRVQGRARLEASGGVTPETVRAIAESGVDTISAGSLTHSARALDMSLQLVDGS